MALSQEVVVAIFSGIGALIGGVTTLVGQRMQASKEQHSSDVALFDKNMQWSEALMLSYKIRLEVLESEVKELRKTLKEEFEKNRDCEDRYTTLEGQFTLMSQELASIRRNPINTVNINQRPL